ncbi:TetR/AcrR family transcriptional regulator [Nocardioides daejeonensis]|uniref:TetR/AcrR family transcriptional regulator n=1 Tax=Nocardioides daejeonensis TaxID=1046556 RepID=UPI000D74EFAD|nr:TetR family transcriptional regulator [Nocardioides daejeonensis]
MAEAGSTRDRIIAAATTQFAQHGIAGARVEQIAKAARTSKERVYAHFRSKAELYRFVAARELTAMADAVPLDPADLPGYAARVHDHVVQHPHRLRLMRWGQLELDAAGATAEDPFQVVVAGKVEQIRQAQESGLLAAEWEPWDVLVFVSQLATAWADQRDAVPEGRGRDAFLAARREAIAEAVQRLFPRAVTGVPHSS